MKTFIILLIFLIKSVSNIELWGQSWKHYPYQPEGSLLIFPADEGYHPHESIEWWYINGHLEGTQTGHKYTFMLSYFYEPIMFFDGFRILSICNETTGAFYTQTLPCDYSRLGQSRLFIDANVYRVPDESWINDTLSDGNIIPFEYLIKASSDKSALNIRCASQKRPLIIADSGLINQGASSYSFYYSMTSLLVTGTLQFEDLSESVNGIAWIDHQYGTFNPYEKENYEWLSIQLENNIELNIWNIYNNHNEIPENPSYKICSILFNDEKSYTTSNFSVERKKYSYSSDGQRCYANQWQIGIDTLDMDLTVTTNFTNHEITLPFRFFEGGTRVEGHMMGTSIQGKGFAELLHSFQKPEIQFIYPTPGAFYNTEIPIQWRVINPDEGNSLQYDIEISYDNGLSFDKIIENTNSTQFHWNPYYFTVDTTILIHLTAHSTDSTLCNDTIIQAKLTNTYNSLKACIGGSISLTINLNELDYSFQWLKNNIDIPKQTNRTLNLSYIQYGDEGNYSCIVRGDTYHDTTITYTLSVGNEYELHEYLSLCSGNEFMGYPLTEIGPIIINDTLLSIAGCDSIINYHVLVEACSNFIFEPDNSQINMYYDNLNNSAILEFPYNFTGIIYIYDLTGKCIFNERLIKSQYFEFSFIPLEAGIYFIKATGTHYATFKYSNQR